MLEMDTQAVCSHLRISDGGTVVQWYSEGVKSLVHCSLDCRTVQMLRIQTPVNDVKKQVGQREDDPGVGVDHVAVAHNEAEVLF